MGRADEGRLRELAAEVAGRAGFDLEDLVVVAAGRRRLVRIVIDSDQGVPLDAAAKVSRDLAEVLDEQPQDPMGEAPYTLEVTSPGIGRPLTVERHFRRSRGRLIAVTLDDDTELIGRIRRVDGEQLELLINLKSTFVPLARITRAKVEVEFNGIPKADAAILAADEGGPVGLRDAANLPGHDENYGADASDGVEADDVESDDVEADVDLDEDEDFDVDDLDVDDLDDEGADAAEDLEPEDAENGDPEAAEQTVGSPGLDAADAVQTDDDENAEDEKQEDTLR